MLNTSDLADCICLFPLSVPARSHPRGRGTEGINDLGLGSWALLEVFPRRNLRTLCLASHPAQVKAHFCILERTDLCTEVVNRATSLPAVKILFGCSCKLQGWGSAPWGAAPCGGSRISLQCWGFIPSIPCKIPPS